MKRFFYLLIVVILASTTGCFLLSNSKGEGRDFQIIKNLELFSSVFRELDLFYVDSIDPEQVIQSGIDAMLAANTDPYTEFYPEDDNTIKELTTGKFGGIGSYIRYYKDKDRIAIVEPNEGSPAARAGLRPGDIILEVDGKDMSRNGKEPAQLSDYVSKSLRGEPGTTCLIKVERPLLDGQSEILELKITRETIKTIPVPYYGMVEGDAGYINMTTFAVENCSKDIKRAVIELKQQGAKSIILDLRTNGGGLLDEAVRVVNLFVPKGQEIVVTRGKLKQADKSYKTGSEPLDLDIPLVVLVSSASASASEIVAGSLQDLDRALIVGTRTFGKGLVQTVRELPYNTTMKVTTSKYYIPSGRCIQAIDYSRRNEEGGIVRTPDSLTNVFHTMNGREVRDGGGIRPDVEVKVEQMPNMLYYMINEDVFFDYATVYRNKHAQIAPVEEFVVSDDDFEEFKQFVVAKNFKYDRQSEKVLKSLKEIADFEGYAKDAAAEFEALEKKLQHNLNKDMDHFKKELKSAIAQEIVKRYYYQKGALIEQLKDDPDLKKAIEVVQDTVLFRNLLSGNNSVEENKQ